MDTENLLCERLINNQQEFLNEVRNYDNINKVINAAYEIVVKEDIVNIFQCCDNLITSKQCEALVKFNNPLNVLYDAWMESDCSNIDMLKDTIIDRALEAEKEMTERSK